MITISFKAEESLKTKLELLSKKKGINASAYIKLILTKNIDDELNELTANGMTFAEELNILYSDAHDPVSGPFKTSKSLMKALRS